MEVRVRLFGRLALRAGTDRISVTLPAGATLDELLARKELRAAFPPDSPRICAEELARCDVLIMVGGNTAREGGLPLAGSPPVMLVPLGVGG